MVRQHDGGEGRGRDATGTGARFPLHKANPLATSMHDRTALILEELVKPRDGVSYLVPCGANEAELRVALPAIRRLMQQEQRPPNRARMALLLGWHSDASEKDAQLISNFAAREDKWAPVYFQALASLQRAGVPKLLEHLTLGRHSLDAFLELKALAAYMPDAIERELRRYMPRNEHITAAGKECLEKLGELVKANVAALRSAKILEVGPAKGVKIKVTIPGPGFSAVLAHWVTNLQPQCFKNGWQAKDIADRARIEADTSLKSHGAGTSLETYIRKAALFLAERYTTLGLRGTREIAGPFLIELHGFFGRVSGNFPWFWLNRKLYEERKLSTRSVCMLVEEMSHALAPHRCDVRFQTRTASLERCGVSFYRRNGPLMFHWLLEYAASGDRELFATQVFRRLRTLTFPSVYNGPHEKEGRTVLEKLLKELYYSKYYGTIAGFGGVCTRLLYRLSCRLQLSDANVKQNASAEDRLEPLQLKRALLAPQTMKYAGTWLLPYSNLTWGFGCLAAEVFPELTPTAASGRLNDMVCLADKTGKRLPLLRQLRKAFGKEGLQFIAMLRNPMCTHSLDALLFQAFVDARCLPMNERRIYREKLTKLHGT